MSAATDISHPQRPAAASGGMAVARAGLHPLIWIYLIAVIIPVGFNVGSVALTGLRLVLICTIIPTTIGLFSGRYGRTYPVDYLFYAHILWASVSMAVNNPANAIQYIGSSSIEFLGGYTLARAYIRTPAAFFALVRAVILLVLASLPFAVSETLNGRAVIPDLISKIPGLNTVADVNIQKRMGLHRVQVYFAHPIHYGLFSSSVLTLTYVGLRDVMSQGARLINCMLVGCCIFLSLSSGALLAALLQMGLITWSVMFRKVEKRWLILFGLFAFMYVVVDLLSNRSPIKVLMSYATFSAHTAYYRSIIFEWGMVNVWNHPLFGLGLNDWVRPSYMRTGTMDNFWLVMAVRHGIPGFLLIALGYGDAIFRVGRRKLVPDSMMSNIRLAWMITFLGLSFTLVTVHIWTAVYSFVFFLLGAGMWIATVPADEAAEASPAEMPDGPRRRPGPVLSRSHLAEDRRGASVADAAATETAATRASGPSRAGRQAADPTTAPDAPRRPAVSYTRFPNGLKGDGAD